MGKTLKAIDSMADNIFKTAKDKVQSFLFGEQEKKPKVKASTWRQVGSYAMSYNGEKNNGELGFAIDYDLDFITLRIRSWQAFLESEIAQTVIKKYITWIIGDGLKLKTEPNKQVLDSENITIDTEQFNEIAEMRFQVWAKSNMSSYNQMDNFITLSQEAFKNSIVGGNVLVVLRLIKGTVSVQLIDIAHLCTPQFSSPHMVEITNRGNTCFDGIEKNSRGTHIAYWVKTSKFGEYERISTNIDDLGLKTAFILKGLTYRLDDDLAMPLISTVLETLKKLERYKEATVGSAEERQKVVYQIVHQNFSTGESPLTNQLAKAFNVDETDDFPITSDGKELASTVAATTNKQTFNMPIGAELKGLESKNELYFKDFYSTNIDIVCATLGIPPNVAMSLYNDSFSASRAATKDWEHTMKVIRGHLVSQFYQPIYNFWLHTQVLLGKIKATGYLESVLQSNRMAVEAYRNCQFTGAMFPHIDPLKEVKAEREKLGELGKDIPLTTIESATEALGGYESDGNLRQFVEERKYYKELNDKAGLTEKETETETQQ
jgi:capsid protein